MTKFKPITVLSNWCYYDQLDGVDLEHGEGLEILWADGKIEAHCIRVQEHETTGRDAVRIKEAFIDVNYRGSEIAVQLNKATGMKARRCPTT